MSDLQKLEPIAEGFVRGILGIEPEDDTDEARERLKEEDEEETR